MIFHKRGKGRESAPNDSDALTEEQETLKQVKFIRILCIAMFGLCFLMYQEVKDIKNNNKTFIQYPSGATGWVTGTDVDDTYTRMMTGYLIAMWGTVSSSSAGGQFGEILKFVHPYYHAEMRQKLIDKAKQIAKYKTVTTVMRAAFGSGQNIEKIPLTEHRFSKIETPVYQVKYKTRSNVLFNDKPDDTTDNKTLSFYFTVDNGSAWLLDIEEYLNEN